MKDKPVSILLDTNIWLDYYIPDRKPHRQAKDLIEFSQTSNVVLVYNSPIIKDVFYLIRGFLKNKELALNGRITESSSIEIREIAWSCVDHMSEIAVAAPCGEPEIWIARQYRNLHHDFEDNLVLGSLETSKATYLVTSDADLLRHSPKAAFNAEDMLSLLQATVA